MKHLLLLPAFVLFVLVLSYTGCSSDSTPTNITTADANDSLMYKFDSLAVYSDDSIQTNAYYLYVESCTITKFKIQCTLTTNDTITPPNPLYAEAIVALTNNNDTGNGAYYNIKLGKDINLVNINSVVTLNVTTPFRLVGQVFLNFVSFPHTLHRYIRAKNFKLYKTI